MLNPFPIMWMSLLAYFTLRVIVAGVLLYLAQTHFQKRREILDKLSSSLYVPKLFCIGLIATELLLGILLLIGAYTQYACLAGIGYAVSILFLYKRIPSDILPQRLFYMLLIACFHSLFITGAGVFAFDLPL